MESMVSLLFLTFANGISNSAWLYYRQWANSWLCRKMSLWFIFDVQCYEASSLAICSKKECVIYLDYFIFILIKWQLSILMHLNLSSCGWKAMGLNKLMREEEKYVPPGAKLVSDAEAESPLHSPFTFLIREEIASPLASSKMLRAPASWGSLHKWGQKTKTVRICWLQPGRLGLG